MSKVSAVSQPRRRFCDVSRPRSGRQQELRGPQRVSFTAGETCQTNYFVHALVARVASTLAEHALVEGIDLVGAEGQRPSLLAGDRNIALIDR